jgi:D-alanyl-D-alanine endopeptidase (penicillin-binding protein 7)
MLAAFVFFSANTIHFVEDHHHSLRAAADPAFNFDFDHVRQKGPYLNVKTAIAVNYDNGEVLYSKKGDTKRSIASITKLVAAMVLLDSGLDLDSVTETITKKDAYRSSRSRLRVGYKLSLRDLLYSGLMNSDNRATRAFARASHGSIDAFVEDMNKKVKILGLRSTSFVEPTGLDGRNVSTAHEVAKILHYALEYDLIKKITSLKRYRVKVLNKPRTTLQMANTNLMVHSKYRVLGGKTGYIRAADYCLVTLLRNKAGERVTLVVLGVPGDRLRFRQARKLADWAFKEIRTEQSLTALP